MIEKSGNIILPLRYDGIGRLASGKFLLIASSLQGLADEQGNVLVEPRFSSLREVGDNLLIACSNDTYGAITDHGLSVVPMIYNQMNYIISERLFLAEKKSDWKRIELK